MPSRVVRLEVGEQSWKVSNLQRGYVIVKEYTGKISSTKPKRPGLDAMMADARAASSMW